MFSIKTKIHLTITIKGQCCHQFPLSFYPCVISPQFSSLILKWSVTKSSSQFFFKAEHILSFTWLYSHGLVSADIEKETNKDGGSVEQIWQKGCLKAKQYSYVQMRELSHQRNLTPPRFCSVRR